MSEKKYVLDIKNVGDDECILMSKGHHDPHEFMAEVRKYYDWPLGFPTHEWIRVIPGNDHHGALYVQAAPHSRGAFPATYTREAYGDDSYEAVKQKDEAK